MSTYFCQEDSFYLHLVAGDAISAPSHPSLAQAELQKDYHHQASINDISWYHDILLPSNVRQSSLNLAILSRRVLIAHAYMYSAANTHTYKAVTRRVE